MALRLGVYAVVALVASSGCGSAHRDPGGAASRAGDGSRPRDGMAGKAAIEAGAAGSGRESDAGAATAEAGARSPAVAAPVEFVFENSGATPLIFRRDCNGTDESVEITTDQCGVQGVFVLDIGKDNWLPRGCDCGCAGDVNAPGSCPMCGACAPPVFETLEPGQRYTYVWDTMFSHRHPKGCVKRYAMPSGFVVPMKACWRKLGASETTCGTFEWSDRDASRGVVTL